MKSVAVRPDLIGKRCRVWISGVPLDCGGMNEIARALLASGRDGLSGYVCVANVHMFIMAKNDDSFLKVMEGAVAVVPDGVPLTWVLRRSGARNQPRIAGPDLMETLCGFAEARGVGVGFLGGHPETLKKLRDNLAVHFPDLNVAYAHSPPFRKLSKVEERAAVDECAAAGARLLFVGLGCPKQELWMARNSSRFPGVMLGVGAAFDYHAGLLLRAPVWMQRSGLEWLYRLVQEPRRLFWRYLNTNTQFVFRVLLPALLSRGVLVYREVD